MNKNFFLHFRPRRVPVDALHFTLTWGLGGMAALLIIQQLLTGMLLGFFYKPLPVQAYDSIQHIQSTVFLGQLVRNLHHWTGHVLVVVVFLHLLRIFLNGAYYPPRRANWLVGLGLAVLVLVANFSGYLLPWDQLSYWAVTIATAMLSYIPFIGISLQDVVRGGEEVGAATLQLFYSIHTIFVPVFILLLMGYHFWLVRKVGGVLIPGNNELSEMKKQKTVSFMPELLVREMSFAAVIVCVLLLFSMGVDAPLGDMANPGLTPPDIKAPWYFLGFQELLLHVHPLIAVCLLPLSIGLFLTLLPFADNKAGKVNTLITTLFIGGSICLLALTITGIWFRGAGMEWVRP